MESDPQKLFVGGISRETSEEDLKQHFSRFGTVLGAVVAKDKSTGTPRCFGFVRFADQFSADRALRHTHVILGREVEVKKLFPKYEQPQTQQQQRPQYYRESQQSSAMNGESGNSNHRNKKIFVGGLASSLTEEEFKNYFERFGQTTDVVVMRDSVTNRPRGFGFVTFNSEESAENVIRNNFHELNNKRVEVKWAIPKEGIQNSNTGNHDSRFGVGRGSVYLHSSYSGPYPSHNIGYGMPVGHHVPGSNVLYGFPYQSNIYQLGYPLAHGMPWNNSMMPGSGYFSMPYANASSHVLHMNGVIDNTGMNPFGYNTIRGMNGRVDNLDMNRVGSNLITRTNGGFHHTDMNHVGDNTAGGTNGGTHDRDMNSVGGRNDGTHNPDMNPAGDSTSGRTDLNPDGHGVDTNDNVDVDDKTSSRASSNGTSK